MMRLRYLTALLLSSVLLVLVLLGAYQHDRQWDWTKNRRHTLSAQSVQAVNALGADVEGLLFVEEGGDPDGVLRRRLERYQLHNPAFKLRVIDPDLNPDIAKRYNVREIGVLVLRRDQRWEKVNTLDEAGITNAMLRLAKQTRQQIAFLTGHGEHELTGAGRMAYRQWVAQLKNEGYGVVSLPLAQRKQIADQVELVVVAGPQSALFEPEKQRLQQWFAAGGKLLLLLDPPSDGGLASLLTPYGIQLQPGLVIDRGAQLLGSNPTTPMITQFPKSHAIFKGVDQVPFLVTAGGLTLQRTAGPWHREKLLAGAEQGWLERDRQVQRQGGQVRFDAQTDLPGPVVMGAAVVEGKKRLVVVRDSDFVADRYSRYPANQALAMGMVRWLLEDEAMSAITPKAVVDAGLTMEEGQVQMLFVLFVILLPFIFFGIGLWVWWSRRHR
ncbi:GldG family protein [Magnetococcus sp. PR-3]|uniref:GldG family protein n=1 Tax=Magnetococcus sp. PR-3 TaxID=3120355 RepID=UPI002FCE0AD9